MVESGAGGWSLEAGGSRKKNTNHFKASHLKSKHFGASHPCLNVSFIPSIAGRLQAPTPIKASHPLEAVLVLVWARRVAGIACVGVHCIMAIKIRGFVWRWLAAQTQGVLDFHRPLWRTSKTLKAPMLSYTRSETMALGSRRVR